MNAIKTNVVNQRLQSGQISLSETETRQALQAALSSQETDSYMLAFQMFDAGGASLLGDDTGLCAAADLIGSDRQDTSLTYTRIFNRGRPDAASAERPAAAGTGGFSHRVRV